MVDLEKQMNNEEKEEKPYSANKNSVAAACGSGTSAVRWLAEGRRVRSRVSGRLGIILNYEGEQPSHQEKATADSNIIKAEESLPTYDEQHLQSWYEELQTNLDDEKQRDQIQSLSLRVERPYQVRLSNGTAYWYSGDQLDPWTRGVHVRSRVSGKRGEIIRVDQRSPPAERPYLVRLDDGAEFWFSLDDVHFEPLRRRGTSLFSDAHISKKECSLTIVPGLWQMTVLGTPWPSLDRSSLIESPSQLQLSATRDGELRGQGLWCCSHSIDSQHVFGSFAVVGAECNGTFEALLHFVPPEEDSSVKAAEFVGCSVGTSGSTDWSRTTDTVGDVTILHGAWSIHETDLDLVTSRPRWGLICEDGSGVLGALPTGVGTGDCCGSRMAHVVAAGREVGILTSVPPKPFLPAASEFRATGHNAGNETPATTVGLRTWWYVDRFSGRCKRVVLWSMDMLCWDDGSVWRRLPNRMVQKTFPTEGEQSIEHDCDDGDSCSELGTPLTSELEFEPPKRSQPRSDEGDAKDENAKDHHCLIFRLSPLRSNGQLPSLRVSFETSGVGPLPEAMKTELQVDGRIIVVDHADLTSILAKGKRRKSIVKGDLFFNDIVLRVGSAISLRFGGEYAGYTWTELIESPRALAKLTGGLYYFSNPLRTRRLTGIVSADGSSVKGCLDDGPAVRATGKTAKAVKVVRAGRVATVSRRPYEDEDFLQIEIIGPAIVRFTFFQTEEIYDTMEIAGVEYSGKDLPPSYFVPEGRRTIMTWKSDESTTDEGWEFSVIAGVAGLQFGSHRCDFGVREAPWNQEQALDCFQSQAIHLRDNPEAVREFTTEESKQLSGKLLWLHLPKPAPVSTTDDVAEDNGRACDGDECSNGKANPTDTDLFHGVLQVPLRHAALAGARAVVFVSAASEQIGVAQLPTGDGSLPDAVSSDSLPPAVIVGSEFGCDVIDTLGRAEQVFGIPRAADRSDVALQASRDEGLHFELNLARAAALDGSRAMARMCLNSDNLLHAVLTAELAQVSRPENVPCVLHGVKELSMLCAQICVRMGVPDTASDSLQERLQSLQISPLADTGTELTFPQGRLESIVKELLRRLMPVSLSLEALLPLPESSGRREVWEHYSKVRRLGGGSFGTVWKAWDGFVGGYVAIKEIELQDDSEARAKEIEEFELLRGLSHPNLVRVLDVYASGKQLYLVTEFAAAGDLTQYIYSVEKVEERWVAAVTRQVLLACYYLHRRKIVHHDIKPANILVTSQRLVAPEAHVPLVLVADFGLAQVERFVSEEARETRGARNGTSYYMPPESALKKSGPKTDVYSTGIMLFELLSGGEAPDPITDDGEVGDVDWDLLTHCSADAILLIRGLIAPDVGLRLSCEAALAVRWLWPSCANEVENASAGVNDHVASCQSRALERLCKRPRDDFLCRAAANLFAGQLGRSDLEDARLAFEALDIDHNGFLSVAELATAIREQRVQDDSSNAGGSTPGQNVADPLVIAREALHAADVHRRGVLEFREFAAACLEPSGGEIPDNTTLGILEKLYVQLGGADDEGVDLQALLHRARPRDDGDLERISELFHRHDRHGDGRLTKVEFFAIFRIGSLEIPWQPPVQPPLPEPEVRLLRGCVEDVTIEGTFVRATKYVTFGHPAIARSNGRWYYEIHIYRCEYPQIGWADTDFALGDGTCECDEGVGDDCHGWGVDGERHCKWHDGNTLWKVNWPRPVVLGCALDLPLSADKVGGGDPCCARMFFSVDGRWWSGDGDGNSVEAAVSDDSIRTVAEPAFVIETRSDESAQTRAFYPAATGVLAGRFCFKEADCRFSPPSASYTYLC